MEIQSRVCLQLPRRRVLWVLRQRCAVDRPSNGRIRGRCSKCPKAGCRASESESLSCSWGAVQHNRGVRRCISYTKCKDSPDGVPTMGTPWNNMKRFSRIQNSLTSAEMPRKSSTGDLKFRAFTTWPMLVVGWLEQFLGVALSARFEARRKRRPCLVPAGIPLFVLAAGLLSLRLPRPAYTPSAQAAAGAAGSGD
jgi:hypothetical protein